MAGTSAQQYDDVLIGYDNNDDGDIADAGDDVQVADLFSSNAITLTYDNDGNLTADGLLGYVYDGWNRLVEVQRSAAGDTTTVATYAYDGRTRRVSKVITNNGTSGTPNDGGNATIHFYYCGTGGVGGTGNMGGTGVSPVRWNICETRNGSNQTTRQWVWGTKYTDEILFMDVNGDPTESNDCDPDAQGGESTYDRRCFYHQDRNWNVVALTEYGDGVGTDARLIERYAYTPYGEFIVLKGDTSSGELANALHTSSVGNPFTHQGLGFDHEKSSYHNRHREYIPSLQLFAQRDRLGYVDGCNLYAYTMDNPVAHLDPTGQASLWDWVKGVAVAFLGVGAILTVAELIHHSHTIDIFEDDIYSDDFQCPGLTKQLLAQESDVYGTIPCWGCCFHAAVTGECGWEFVEDDEDGDYLEISCGDDGSYYKCPVPEGVDCE